MTEKCETCGGEGWVTDDRVEPGCCGDTWHGECRGHCVIPVRVCEQVMCLTCGGTGKQPKEAERAALTQKDKG